MIALMLVITSGNEKS